LVAVVVTGRLGCTGLAEPEALSAIASFRSAGCASLLGAALIADFATSVRGFAEKYSCQS